MENAAAGLSDAEWSELTGKPASERPTQEEVMKFMLKAWDHLCKPCSNTPTGES